MSRRARKPRPPPTCRRCGKRLAWLRLGGDRKGPVDPASRILIDMDAQPVTATGWDEFGYFQKGLLADENYQAPRGHRVIPCWNSCGCFLGQDPGPEAPGPEPVSVPEPALGGADRAAGEEE